MLIGLLVIGIQYDTILGLHSMQCVEHFLRDIFPARTMSPHHLGHFSPAVSVTFGRLAVIDFDECYCLLIYCTVLYLDFARWSILDGVDSGLLVKLLVTCILDVSFLVYSGLEFSRCQRSI